MQETERLWTLQELADHLGVEPETVHTWAIQLDLDVPRTADGEFQFPADLISIFEQVREMRRNSRTFQTIQKVIWPRIKSTRMVPLKEDTPAQPADGFSEMDLLPTIQRVTELARDYSSATHRIGQLEARLQYLEEQLEVERLAHAGAREEVARLREALSQQTAKKKFF